MKLMKMQRAFTEEFSLLQSVKNLQRSKERLKARRAHASISKPGNSIKFEV